MLTDPQRHQKTPVNVALEHVCASHKEGVEHLGRTISVESPPGPQLFRQGSRGSAETTAQDGPGATICAGEGGAIPPSEGRAPVSCGITWAYDPLSPQRV